MAAVVSSAEEAEADQKKRRMAELRHELQQIEVDVALEEAVATIHGVTMGGADNQSELGPTHWAEVAVEGVTTRALLDTGSPATIASLKWILEVLAKERPRFPSGDHWRAAMELRLKPSTLDLQSYGGGRLNLVRQLTVTLSTPGHTVEAVIQVQSGAPVDLLLGTDPAWQDPKSRGGRMG